MLNFLKKKSNLPKLLCIVGPTSSGKTELAVKIAQKYNGEIISSDSRQIYREMNIGTNKFSPYKKSKEKYFIKEIEEPQNKIIYKNINHYLIDIVKPDEDFSLYQFQKTAKNIIKTINRNNKLAIMAGGTGLYVNSVTENLKIPHIPPDLKLRKNLEQKTTEDLYRMFKKLNNKGCKTIDKNNKRRLIRGIEIATYSPNTDSILKVKEKPIFDVKIIGIKTEREEMYKKINNWVDKIFGDSPADSLVLKEMQNLLKKYRFENNKNLQGLVYKQLGWFLKKYPSRLIKNKKVSFEESKELSKIAVRNYAKRQMTWFKKDKKIEWHKKEKIKDIFSL